MEVHEESPWSFMISVSSVKIDQYKTTGYSCFA